MNPFERTELLLGKEAVARLGNTRIEIFGIGGVGSYAAEAVARAGVGKLTLVDPEVVVCSNINRQIHADHDTIGRPKAVVMAERIRRINPRIEVEANLRGFRAETPDEFLSPSPDYVIDAIDRTPAKIALLEYCVRHGIPAVSSMGAGSKLDPESVHVTDIDQTRHCPLARAIRKQLRKSGIRGGITAVYSEELPIIPDPEFAPGEPRQQSGGDADDRRPQGTISFMPGIFGLYCAGAAIRYLLSDVSVRRRGDTPAKEQSGRGLGSVPK